jgi:hypothetical protein
VNFELVSKNFAKDLSNLAVVVNWATDMKKRGSFSDRRPDLGRMFACPVCHTRRRANGPRCCNPAFATTRRAWTSELGFFQDECVERSHPSPFGKQFLRKLRHKKHGQSKQFKIRQLVHIFNQNFGGGSELKMAAREMHVAMPDLIGIPPFAEKFFGWREEMAKKAERKRVSISRRINRGLI